MGLRSLEYIDEWLESYWRGGVADWRGPVSDRLLVCSAVRGELLDIMLARYLLKPTIS